MIEPCFAVNQKGNHTAAVLLTKRRRRAVPALVQEQWAGWENCLVADLMGANRRAKMSATIWQWEWKR